MMAQRDLEAADQIFGRERRERVLVKGKVDHDAFGLP